MRAGERRDDSACLNVPHSAVPRPHLQPLISFTLPIRTQHPPLSLSLFLVTSFSLFLSLSPSPSCFDSAFLFPVLFPVFCFFPSPPHPSRLYSTSTSTFIPPPPPPIHPLSLPHSTPPTHAFLRPRTLAAATARALAFPSSTASLHHPIHPFRASSWLSRASDRPRFFLFFVAHTAFAGDHFVLHG